MSFKIKLASVFAIVAGMMVAAVGTTGAVAQDRIPIVLPGELRLLTIDGHDADLPDASQPRDNTVARTIAQTDTPDTLAEMVEVQPQPASLSPELQCLAGAIYFEAKSQALAGQLAVGRVVVNRSKSGRFPASYCGVVYQRAQFGFVHGTSMPAIARGSKAWRNAVAVAQIANGDAWHSDTEGALYFHAARVAPKWNRIRIARLEDHIFYR